MITTALSVDTGKVAVTLGSRPKLSDADIRSYLAVGRPAGTDPTQTGEETNPLAAGASLALSAALGSVAGGAGRTLGFDVVQVLQDRNGDQTLVAGKYVSPPLYLGFREPIVARNDPTKPQSSQSSMEWEVEYAGARASTAQRAGRGQRVPRVPAATAVSRGAGVSALAALTLVATLRVAAAQDSLLVIRPDAQVGSVGFRFPRTQSFSTVELTSHLAVKARGSLYDFRRILGKLPLIPSPGRFVFDPIELQKDVVRLRRFYGRAGYLEPRVDYEVRTNRPGSLVNIVFVIDEGPRSPFVLWSSSARPAPVIRPYPTPCKRAGAS